MLLLINVFRAGCFPVGSIELGLINTIFHIVRTEESTCIFNGNIIRLEVQLGPHTISLLLCVK